MQQYIQLLKGIPMPLVGLGTYPMQGQECENVVAKAYAMGYRLFDTAVSYQNHRAVGSALQKGNRQDIFLTSKISLLRMKKHTVKATLEEIEQMLKELNTSYLDLLLLHFPIRDLPMKEIFKGMREAKNSGKVRAIGVSNCTIHHLQDIFSWGFDDIEVNQVEFHPLLNQEKLLRFCQTHHIHLQAYRPFGKGELISYPLLVDMAKKYKKTPSQLILRWLIEKKISTIPKASSNAHLKENIDLDFPLEDTDYDKIESMNQNQRYCSSDNFDFDY